MSAFAEIPPQSFIFGIVLCVLWNLCTTSGVDSYGDVYTRLYALEELAYRSKGTIYGGSSCIVPYDNTISDIQLWGPDDRACANGYMRAAVHRLVVVGDTNSPLNGQH